MATLSADCPNIVRRQQGDTEERPTVVMYRTPPRTIPVQNGSNINSVAVPMFTHGPDVIRSCARDIVKLVNAIAARIRARNHREGAPVPMQDDV